jgi:hypothetical protein
LYGKSLSHYLLLEHTAMYSCIKMLRKMEIVFTFINEQHVGLGHESLIWNQGYIHHTLLIFKLLWTHWICQHVSAFYYNFFHVMF